jgi:hypothetical protein
MINLFRKRTGAKLSLVLLSIFLFLLLFAPAASAAMMGDIDGSGSINVLDVVLAKQHVLGVQLLTPAQKLVADVNGSGDVDVLDVDLIMRKALGLITEFPFVQLQVSSVTAVNARQVAVVFNAAVTKSLAENPANYEVYKQGALFTNVFGTEINGAKATLQEDGRTVWLTLNNLPGKQEFVQGTNFNRVVVKAAAGLTADYTNSSVAFLDTTAPTFLSVRSIGPDIIELTFSEPVMASTPVAGLALTGGPDPLVGLNLATAEFNDAKRTVTIKTTSNLTPGATYTLAVQAGDTPGYLKDYVGLKIVPASRQFVHTATTTVPTVSAAAINQHTVRLTFDRPVELKKLNPPLIGTNVEFRLNVNTDLAIKRNGDDMDGSGKDFIDAMVIGSAGTQYDVTFTNPMIPGTNTLYIHYLIDSALFARIGDNWNNILPNNTAVTFTVPETTTPYMISAKVAGPHTVKITYSRTVTNNGFAPEQYKYYADEAAYIADIADIAGVEATSVSASGNIVTIVFPGSLTFNPLVDYPNAVISYKQSATTANRTRDQATGGYAFSPNYVIGILASD